MGIVPTADEYSGSSIGNLPIGQGLSVTPLQMMAGYAAIANGGALRAPRLIESVDGEPVPDPEGEQVISEKTAAQVRKMLEGVLGPFGTAPEVERPRLRARRQDRHRPEGRRRHLLRDPVHPLVRRLRAGRDPKLLVSVVVDEPKGGDYYGGTVAAPAFGEIASFALPYLGIAPDRVGPPSRRVPRIAAMRLDELSAGLPGGARPRRTAAPRSPTSPSTAARSGPGTLFVCVPGMTTDGHDFAPAAVEAGAAALVVERELDADVPQAARRRRPPAMAPLAARLFGDPSAELRLRRHHRDQRQDDDGLPRPLDPRGGRDCSAACSARSSRSSAAVEEEVERTTPEAIDLQRTLRRMVDAGDRACAMEVSSHALVLGRADAIHFDVAAFTNLTQDHLDFHADMEDYFAAKRLLFAARSRGAWSRPGCGRGQRRRRLRGPPARASSRRSAHRR